jgi:hypothetical protein
MTHTHTHTRTYTHLPLCHGHTVTLFIVTDTHQHIDRGLYTYMTSYLDQPYRLSILIDRSTLFINSWSIRLSVDNVLLINNRSLSMLSVTSNDNFQKLILTQTPSLTWFRSWLTTLRSCMPYSLSPPVLLLYPSLYNFNTLCPHVQVNCSNTGSEDSS